MSKQTSPLSSEDVLTPSGGGVKKWSRAVGGWFNRKNLHRFRRFMVFWQYVMLLWIVGGAVLLWLK